MTTFWQAPAVLVVFVAWLTSPPAGFADIARREALRRQATSASVKSFSNLDLPPVPLEALIAAAAATPPPIPDDEVSPPISLGGEVGVTGQGAQPAGAATPTTERATATAPGAVAPAAAPGAATAPGAPGARGDEKHWRDRITSAQAMLERDQVLMDAMQSRINALNTDIVNRDDPAQQAELRQQLQRAVAEQQRLQGQVAAAHKAIDAIRTEARRLGIPPGWVR